jgi:uncharacterized phage protein gp47/JayE
VKKEVSPVARPDFINPEFLEGTDTAEIQARMMKNLPSDISDMEGDFPYDFTMPSAIEISKMINFDLVRAMMIAFPEYAWGRWLDLHGDHCYVTRKAATPAYGYVQVEALYGVSIPAGTIFAIPATERDPSVQYESTEDVFFDADGVKSIYVKAVIPGTSGNCAVDTITILVDPIQGVKHISNAERMVGGTDTETDDAFYERIHEALVGAQWYVANDTDFRRWAMEVEGIGECIVDPVWNGPGTVRLILVDSAGMPTTQAMTEAVYDHIISNSDRSKRIAPTGTCALTVIPCEERMVSFRATDILLEEGATLDLVKEQFLRDIKPVFRSFKDDNILRYNACRTVLSNRDGVIDLRSFRVDGLYYNVRLEMPQFCYTNKALLDFTLLPAIEEED